MRKKVWIAVIPVLLLGAATGYYYIGRYSPVFKNYKIGDAVDSLNGVKVYYNGNVSHTGGRNKTADGYNLGLKYQCVEFVKRYYYEHYHHKMPDSYGHAKDFFDTDLADGALNKKRNLIQYTNPSFSKPEPGDLLVFGATSFNGYGHVAIVSQVTDEEVEIIQQNPGRAGRSRITFPLIREQNRWSVANERLKGWLRKQ